VTRSRSLSTPRNFRARCRPPRGPPRCRVSLNMMATSLAIAPATATWGSGHHHLGSAHRPSGCREGSESNSGHLADDPAESKSRECRRAWRRISSGALRRAPAPRGGGASRSMRPHVRAAGDPRRATSAELVLDGPPKRHERCPMAASAERTSGRASVGPRRAPSVRTPDPTSEHGHHRQPLRVADGGERQGPAPAPPSASGAASTDHRREVGRERTGGGEHVR